MIMPETLRSLAESCDDTEFVGHVLRALGGQSVELTVPEKAMVAVIQNDSKRLSENIEKRKQKDAQRQAKWRAERQSAKKEVVTPCHDLSRVTKRDNDLSRVTKRLSRASQSVRPSVSPSVSQSLKPVPVPVRACARARESGSAGTGTGAVDLSKIDTSDEGIMSGAADYVLIAQAVTGDTSRSASAFWRKWVKQGGEAGEGEFREELFTFRRELAAGEDVRNKGAAFTARLKKRRPIKK